MAPPGQEGGYDIYAFGIDGEIERGIAPSYRVWLSSLADRLEAGRFLIDEYGYLWPDREVSPN